MIVTDTAPTEAIWERARHVDRLSAVFLEVSFPDSMAELAGVAKHLTPNLFRAELLKLGRPVRCIAIHMKARFASLIADELCSIEIPGVPIELGRPGFMYEC
jgi:hypothetical protein